jgi:glycosyltransferase involved in cell wall biosynthesis
MSCIWPSVEMGPRPLVSAIMPTRDRAHLLPLAIAALIAQDWPHERLELIVVDDGAEPVGSLIRELLAGSGIELEYLRMCGSQLEDWQRRIGAKRNLACEMARGEFIVHWDDDDWSAPGRIREQVELLEAGGKALTGYHTLLFWDAANRQASRYTNTPTYACGSSFCYRRQWWKQHLFPAANIGEDNHFVTEARDAGQLVALPGRRQMVARIHAGNTSARNPLQWPEVATAEIPQEFFARWHKAMFTEPETDGADFWMSDVEVRRHRGQILLTLLKRRYDSLTPAEKQAVRAELQAAK